jgi:TonB family protein
MEPLLRALIVYSSQVLLIVSAAAMAEALLRASVPGARLTYWRALGALCLALPFFRMTSSDFPAVSSAFAVLPVAQVANATAAQVLPEVGPAFLWVWASGAIAGLIWLLAGAWRIRQLRQRSVLAQLEPQVEALRAALAPHAEFRWSDELRQPVTVGIRRPLILLPRRFDDLTPEARGAVACHELLHVARRDWLWIVLEAHIRVAFWFHPAFWWLIDRIQLLREQVVDELVVARTSSRRDYMLALMMFADCHRPTLSSAFLRRRHLKSRLRELLKESHMSFPRLASTMTALALLMAAVTAATVRALPLDLSAIAQGRSGVRLEFRLAESAFTPGLVEVIQPGSGQRVYLHPAALATAADISSARVIDNGNSIFSIEVIFSRPAAARMASGTGAHLGRPLAIVLDGQVISVATVRAQISDTALLTGPFDAATAQSLATRLAPVAPPQNGQKRDDVVLPVPIHQERPIYTPEAMAAQIEGSVLLESVVRADGSVGDVRVIEPFDTQYGLDQQAVEALKRWTWKPGTKDGKPVQVAVQVQMTFTLK